ncbi:MAG: hypothetical protein H6Q14_2353 [Bacteroidetes bacterium]|nr:hypothetical protein [Bacteroidota bacterium]
MKVLIAYQINSSTDNPFVEILYNYFVRSGIEVVASVKEFWEASVSKYDIIHFHWPEEVVGWNVSDTSVLSRLRTRIGSYKEARVKLVYTRHNAIPHYGNTIITEAYKIIEEYSDVVVHMANYSLCEFQQKYPNSRNVIIPHHLYEGRGEDNVSQLVAREKLNLPANSFIILCSGKFRKWEEVRMVLKSFFQFKDKRKLLLAPRLLPGFSPNSNHSNKFKRRVSKLGYRALTSLLRKLHVIAGNNEHIVAEALFYLQLSASDVLLIQRKQILNSGNLPLAFLFRKPVVGPDAGNVGEILRITGNPVFDPMKTGTIVDALNKIKDECFDLGQHNFEYAKKHWSISIVGQEYIELYSKLTRNCKP